MSCWKRRDCESNIWILLSYGTNAVNCVMLMAVNVAAVSWCSQHLPVRDIPYILFRYEETLTAYTGPSSHLLELNMRCWNTSKIGTLNLTPISVPDAQDCKFDENYLTNPFATKVRAHQSSVLRPTLELTA